MGRPTTSGIFRGKRGWEVDKVVGRDRLRHRGAESAEAAEGWLKAELQKRAARAAGSQKTFDQAAAHYVVKYAEKVSLDLDIYALGLAMPFIGHLPLDQVDDVALEPFVEAMRAGKPPATRPLKANTINLALDKVRRVLVLAARSWRENGKPWLPGLPPLITPVDVDDEGPPQQLAWRAQREHLQTLPPHLACMALFDLQNGARENVVCNLRWQWEVRLPELGFSVFVVPKRYVKGRKADRVLVCNSVAQSVVEAQRGKHPERVFVYSHPHRKVPVYKPVGRMFNTAWRKWRKRSGLQGFKVHHLRHTVGMRLREAGVNETTRADVLWHSHEGQTAHYSMAQVLEIREGLELITSERRSNNLSLASIIAQQRMQAPAEVPAMKEAAAK